MLKNSTLECPIQVNPSSGAVLPIAPSYNPNPTEIDAAEQYADYTTRIVWGSDDFGDRETDDANGITYRWSGSITIQLRLSRFTIELRSDAHENDLRALERIAARVKAGFINQYPYRGYDSTKFPGTVFKNQVFGIAETAVLGRLIIPCTTVGCESVGSYHLGDGPESIMHWGEEIAVDGAYRVQACKRGSQP